ncbi:MAG: hypothetical protein JST66_05360 [Bacteroidetes bacterium]|nr:hypothetical protein [Bacteroidota bacterium]
MRIHALVPRPIVLACIAALGTVPSNGTSDRITPPAKGITEAGHRLHKEQQAMIKITIGPRVFTATLDKGPAADALRGMLPLVLDMQELNGNEKYQDLPDDLPTHASNPGTIRNGDLMLYGSRTLVLFYKTFPTSYSYTRLGKVDDVTGLEAALGSGNVTVTFEME